jgi:RNA polymerase sigma factor (sigma-70 family)
VSPSISLRVLRTQSDARLLEMSRDGHERAFEALVHRYRRPLLGYCRRLLLPEARAEDALQQGLLQAWLALSDGCEVRDAKAWLYRIVHNAAVSALRRSGYDYVELDEALHGAGALEGDIDRRIAVREALAGLAALPEAQREVLLRTAVQGHSHEQVAAEMGLSDGAVRGLIYRARATLRTAVTAVTPPPLLAWAARAAETGAAHPQLAETAGGTGSAGVFGLLLKGGAVVVSAGVLATGAGLVGHGAPAARASRGDEPRRQHLVAPARASGGPGAPSALGTTSRGQAPSAGHSAERTGHRRTVRHAAAHLSPVPPPGSGGNADGSGTGGGRDAGTGAGGQQGSSAGDGGLGRAAPGSSASGDSGNGGAQGVPSDGTRGGGSGGGGPGRDGHAGPGQASSESASLQVPAGSDLGSGGGEGGSQGSGGGQGGPTESTSSH